LRNTRRRQTQKLGCERELSLGAGESGQLIRGLNLLKVKNRKLVQIILGTVITLVCLWLAVPGSGLASKWNGLHVTLAALKSAEFIWLVPMMGLLAIFYLTKAYRWALLLVPVRRLRTHQVFPATIIGFMGNNVLPAHLGELVRMLVLSKSFSLSKTSVFSSIVLERLLDAIAVIILLGFAGLSLKLPESYEYSGIVAAAGAFVALLCLILYAYRSHKVLLFWNNHFHFIPAKAHARVARMITSSSQGMDTLRNPTRFLYLIFFSVLHWSILVLYAYLVFMAFSIELPFQAAILVLCGTMVAAAVPAAPGFWGVVQAAFTIVLKPLGVPAHVALAASVYYLASQYVPTTATGLIFLAHSGFRLAEISSESIESSLEAAS